MRHERVYHPQPPEEEKLTPCVKCGSEEVKALDNWLLTPCIRVIVCKKCGRMANGTGDSIAECKAAALKNWQDKNYDLPPWWDEESLAAGMLEDDG